MQVKYSFTPGELGKGFQRMYLPMAEAASAAIAEAGEIAKTEARADIRAAGFSARWQNALRVDVYPRRGKTSVNAVAHLYHKIFYAGVFEEGTAISSNKLMWLPLPSLPKRKLPVTLNRLRKAAGGARLKSFNSKTGKPLLAVQVRLNKAQAAQSRPKLTMAQIRRGKSGKGLLRFIPVFHGVNRAKMPKKFSITQIVTRARDRLADLYVKNLKGD